MQLKLGALANEKIVRTIISALLNVHQLVVGPRGPGFLDKIGFKRHM